jgi:hypothetical protein
MQIHFIHRVFYSATLERDLRRASKLWITMQKFPDAKQPRNSRLSRGILLTIRTFAEMHSIAVVFRSGI